MKQKKRMYADLAILTSFTILAVVSMLLIPQLKVDSSMKAFMPQSSDIVILNDENDDMFGVQDVIFISIRTRYGTVLDPEVIAIIKEITEKAEILPHVNDVTSLSNVEYIKNSEWGMEVVDLYPEDLEGQQAIDTVIRRLADWQEVYKKTLISEDLHVTDIIVELETGENEENEIANQKQVYHEIQELVKEHSGTLDISFAGEPVLEEELSSGITHDLSLLIPLTILVILAIMFFTFHRIDGIIYPLLSLIVSCILTMGVMSFFNITFTIASLMVPIILMVVGSAYSIHVLSHFYDLAGQAKGFLKHEQISEMLKQSLKDVRLSVTLAGLTTVAGFLSLLSSPLAPFRTFAILTALGVSFALLSAFYMIPAMVRLRYHKGADANHFGLHESKMKADGTKDENQSKILTGLLMLTRNWKVPTILVFLVMLGSTIWGIRSIDTRFSFIEFFPKNSAVVKTTNLINDNLSGTGQITLRVDAPNKGDILDPGFLSDMEQFSDYLKENHSTVTIVNSLVPQVKRMNKILNLDSIPYGDSVSDTEEGMPDFDDDDGFDFFSNEDDLFSFEETEEKIAVNENIKSEEKDINSEPGLTYEEAAGLMSDSLFSSGLRPDIQKILHAFFAAKNFQGEAYNEIPVDPAKYGLETKQDLKNLLSQYLLLYSGSLDSMLNDSLEPNIMLVSIMINDDEAALIGPILNEIDNYWTDRIPEDWSYHIGGTSTLIYALNKMVTQSQIISVILALVTIFIILVIVYRSFLAGVLGLIPVLGALAGIFFTMVSSDISLNAITALLSSVAVGIGVDYSIHILSAYKRSNKKGADDPLSTIYRTTGRAVFFNAVSVAAGFLTLTFSSFIPLRQVGFLFAVSMLSAGFTSLVILPIVIEKWKPNFLGFAGNKNLHQKPDII